MKNTLLSFGLAGLTSALLSFNFFQKSGEIQEPKKARHIKMLKMENGKKIELDTVLTNDDVFVWNGDTVNPPKHFKKVNPSGIDKMEKFDVKVDHQDGKEKVMVIKHKDGKNGEPMIWNTVSDDDMEILTEDNDSTGKRIVVRKRLKDGNENQVFYFKNGDTGHFPPMPPVPPVPPVPYMQMMQMQHSGQIINLNDPNIISFKRKKMSGDREKIEIIRKKSEAPEDMTFDFKFDNGLMAPEAPEAPELIRELKGENQKMKIMEKEIKVNGKKGKEIKVEVESVENK
jgi:hypothetical protein